MSAETIISYDFNIRVAQNFISKINNFKSEIYLIKERQINARSLVGILSLCLNKGDRICVRVIGDSAKSDLEQIVNILIGDINEM